MGNASLGAHARPGQSLSTIQTEHEACRGVAVHFTTATTPRETVRAIRDDGMVPTIIYPAGVVVPPRTEPEQAKRPMGKAWGLTAPTDHAIASRYAMYPTAGVGLALGPGKGPEGTWVVAFDRDGPTAIDTQRDLLGGEEIETLGWSSRRGGQSLYTADPARMAPLVAAGEGKGQDAGVIKVGELEIRAGGEGKQVQSVCPPSVGQDGVARAWCGPSFIAPLPEVFYENLAARIRPPGKVEPVGTARGEDRPKAASRAEAWFQKALEGEAKKVASAPEGSRHHALIAAARTLGGRLHHGILTRDQVTERLTEAARQCGLPSGEATEAILDGLKYGEAEPLPWPANLVNRHSNGNCAPQNPAIGGGLVDRQEKPRCTDTGNAARIVREFKGDLLYCKPWGTWLIQDGQRWREDTTGQIVRFAKKMVCSIAAEASAASDEDERKALLRWALTSESRQRIEAAIVLAQPELAVEPHQLDRDPYLLNCANGVVDLKTGKLLPHAPSQRITKMCSVNFDANATCPQWERHLKKWTGGNDELAEFLKRAVGYSCTADVCEHVLFFLYGSGRNGKGTFLEVILRLLSDYACTVDPSLITVRFGEDHPTGLTDLDGKRFVPTEEVGDGKRLAEALVKRLTGGNRIKARRMRQDNYEFEATHKLWLAANHKPVITGTDEGIWSRIKLIPFTVFIPPEERVKNLASKLVQEEASGILNWIIRGCREWQLDGLKEPSVVKEAVSDYKSEMDQVGRFIDECCFNDKGGTARTKAADIYKAYANWCKASGEREVLTATSFGTELTARGYGRDKSNSIAWRVGLGLLKAPAPDPAPEDSTGSVPASTD